MTELEQIGGDLRFVRGALASSERAKSPAALYFFWAAAVLVGFVLVDFRPALVGPYWAVDGTCRVCRQRLHGMAPRGDTRVRCPRRTAGGTCFHWGGMLAGDCARAAHAEPRRPGGDTLNSR